MILSTDIWHVTQFGTESSRNTSETHREGKWKQQLESII
jgi:hypothetical protein